MVRFNHFRNWECFILKLAVRNIQFTTTYGILSKDKSQLNNL